MNLSYTDLKAIIVKKNLAWQYEERANKYRVFAFDNAVGYQAFIHKAPISVGGLEIDAEAVNQADFENHYKAIANYPVGERNYSFTTPDFMYNGSGVLATATKNANTAIDMVIPGTLGTFQYINGAQVITQNAVFGDWASSIVIDVDNVLGYGANTVLSNYITKWYIDPAASLNLTTLYAGKVPSGVYIRVTYHSVGTVNDVGVAINYRLHSPL